MPTAPRMGAAVIMAAPPVAVVELEAVAAVAADSAELATDAAELARLAVTELAEASAELILDAADEVAEVIAPESELYTVEKPVMVA